MRTTFEAPQVEVRFTTVSGERFTAVGTNFGGDVVAVQTNKTLYEPAGTFSVTMIVRNDFVDHYGLRGTVDAFKGGAFLVFRPMTLVDIYINGKEVMLGIVDDIRREYTAENFRWAYTISGRDMGALVLDHKIWWDDSISGFGNNQDSLLGPIYKLGLLHGNPAQIIEQIFNNWMKEVDNRGGFKFADGDTLQDKMIVRAESAGILLPPTTDDQGITAEWPAFGALCETSYGDFYPVQFGAQDIQGDLFTFIRGFSSPPFNELFVDTGGCDAVLAAPRLGGSPVTSIGVVDADGTQTVKSYPEHRRVVELVQGRAFMVYRPCPFDNIDDGVEPPEMMSLLSMQDLVQHVVEDEDVSLKSFACGRGERASMYVVSPVGALVNATTSKMITPPEYDDEALSRYGYNPMEVQIDFFFMAADRFTLEQSEYIVSLMQKRLKSWYKNSDKFFRGTITCKGRPEIRVGTALTYNSLGIYEKGLYYVTGVSHNFSYGGSFSTTLTVERGRTEAFFGRGK